MPCILLCRKVHPLGSRRVHNSRCCHLVRNCNGAVCKPGGRYGGRKTLEKILAEKNPTHVVRLLRYHLGWSPGKIAAEMNRREILKLGLPWHEDDVCRIIKGLGRFSS